MKTTVIYHSADFDGLFCREIARKFLPPDTEFIGWDFGDEPVNRAKLLASDRVYIMDLPVDRVMGMVAGAIMEHQNDVWVREHIIWIDHHKSSIDSHPTSIPGYRIDGVAACRLAWQWFKRNGDVGPDGGSFPMKEHYVDRELLEPLAVRLAGEYDIWDKRDPRAEVFQFGLRNRDLNNADWEAFLTECEVNAEVGELLDAGIKLQRYQQRSDTTAMSRSFMVDWHGLMFLTLNTAIGNSLTFASKDVPETGHSALMMFRYDGQHYHFSLYHAKHRTDLDLSTIAVKYGGGGHRGACGFKLNKLPFA